MCAAINDSTVDVSKKGAALAAAAAGDFAHLPIFDRAIECSSRERIRAIQLEKLIAQVEWTYERVPWYRQRMDEMGVSPRDIRTLEDVRKLPFTDKSVLRDTFPYGLTASSSWRIKPAPLVGEQSRPSVMAWMQISRTPAS